MSETYQLNQSRGEYTFQTLACIDATALLSFNDDNAQNLHVAKTTLMMLMNVFCIPRMIPQYVNIIHKRLKIYNYDRRLLSLSSEVLIACYTLMALYFVLWSHCMFDHERAKQLNCIIILYK